MHKRSIRRMAMKTLI